MKNTLNFREGFWRLADPKISLASMASMFLGVAAAARAGGIDPLWLILTILGIFAIEVAKNASGEIFDFDSGNDQAVEAGDRSPFSGGKRVLVDGILTRNQVIVIAAVSYLVGMLVGLAIALYREPRVLWLGILGVGLAYLYHAPPLKLSYRGFGELAVTLAYGPLICAGTYLVQRGTATPDVLAVSLLLGLLIGNFLLINEFPDFHADRFAGKKTLVVRLGRASASRLHGLIFGLFVIGLVCLPLVGLPPTVWLGAIAVPTGLSASRRLLRDPETVANIIPAQAGTLLTFLLFSLGAGLGLILA